MNMTAPLVRPARPYFSSGPCAKRPGWQIQNLQDAPLGRSHRAKAAKTRLTLGIDLTRELLQVPAGYRIGIVPGSDTGAVEMALWSLLGHRGVDVLAWESFGEGWVTDIVKQLKLKDVRILKAGYGDIVDLKTVNFDNDVVFTWNGTTSGVRVPNGDWIAADRKGLTICDATSAAFAQRLDGPKLDVVTFSWQKVLGGEAGHGMLILSPRAAARLRRPTLPVETTQRHLQIQPLPLLHQQRTRLRGGEKTIRVMRPSSIVGCQRMVHHIFLRDDFGYFRFAVNSASDGQFSRLIIPILDFRIVFGVPMDEDPDANEHILGFGLRNDSLLDGIHHCLCNAAFRRAEHLGCLFLVLDLDLVEHHGGWLSHHVGCDQCEERVITPLLIGKRAAESNFCGASPGSHNKIDMRQFITLAHEGFPDKNPIDL